MQNAKIDQSGISPKVGKNLLISEDHICHKRPVFAESDTFAKTIAALHRFLVPSLSKTLTRPKADMHQASQSGGAARALHQRAGHGSRSVGRVTVSNQKACIALAMV
jgi:hypothetical protein